MRNNILEFAFSVWYCLLKLCKFKLGWGYKETPRWAEKGKIKQKKKNLLWKVSGLPKRVRGGWDDNVWALPTFRGMPQVKIVSKNPCVTTDSTELVILIFRNKAINAWRNSIRHNKIKIKSFSHLRKKDKVLYSRHLVQKCPEKTHVFLNSMGESTPISRVGNFAESFPR